MKIFTKHFLILLSAGLLCSNNYLHAQSMSINTSGNPPAASAGLDIDFTGKGLLIPRMATGSRPASPAVGLLIYNTTTNVFEYWNGSAWSQVGGTSGWGLSGNALTGTLPASPTEWIGSSNGADFIIKTNGSERVRVQSGGNVGIGGVTPSSAVLQVNSGASTPLYLGTSSGYTYMGALNAGWSHFYTDRPRYYFSTGGTFDTGNIGSYDEDLSLQTSGTTRITALNSNGNVGISSTSPGTKFVVNSGQTTLSRGTTYECCGNAATLALGEATTTDGNRASISFHNGGEAEGTLRLIQNTVGSVNTNSRRIQLYDNQAQGMGLEFSGGLFFGNNNSRSQTRTNAGLRGDAGAQSGFFENDGGTVTNFPAGASGWWHLIDVRHSNPANNYAMQIAGSFFDQDFYVRKTNNNASQAWEKILTTGTSVDLINIYFLYSTGNLCISGGWADFPGMSQSLALKAGDKVMVWANGGSMIDSDCDGFSNATNGTYNVRVAVDGADFPNGAWGRYGLDYGSAWIAFTAWSISGLYDVTADATYTFKTQGSLQSGNAVLAGGDNTSSLQATMIIFVYRP